MGSGKTHLLTLILHLYAVCPEDYAMYLPLLEDYIREGCYSQQLAKDTVVLAFDLRTPGEVYRSPLKLRALGFHLIPSAACSCRRIKLPSGMIGDEEGEAELAPDVECQVRAVED